MSGNNQDPILRGEFDTFKQLLDERLKRTETKMILYLGIAVGLIRLDIPTPVTATAIAAMVIKGATAFLGPRL